MWTPSLEEIARTLSTEVISVVPPADIRRLAILADDLTGAADAAAPFAARGLTVSVLLFATPPSDDTPPTDAISPPDTTGPGDAILQQGLEVPEDVEVLAFVTDNRWRPAPEAAERMRAAVSRVRAWRPELLFVKIDSTLRGRVRADVAEALGAWGGTEAVATPAFPGQGRIVCGGVLVVHGEAVAGRVAEHFPGGVRVVDAESHEDLVTVARDIVDHAAVAVGSGGLARALAEVLLDESRPHRRPRTAVAGVLVVVGTAHAATREQVRALLAAGAELVVIGPSTPSPVQAATTALRDGRRVVVTCEVAGEVEPDSAQAAALAEDVSQVVRAIVDAAPPIGLVLTGGATALAVAAALGARELRLLSEVAVGLPLGEMVIDDRRIPVVTKSGGFGAQDSLCRAAEALEDCA